MLCQTDVEVNPADPLSTCPDFHGYFCAHEACDVTCNGIAPLDLACRGWRTNRIRERAGC
jgi:hypothetical protein